MTLLAGVLLATLLLLILAALTLAAYDLASFLHYRWRERASAPRRVVVGRHRR